MDKKTESKRKKELSDICAVVNSPEGRRFYWRVMELAAVFVQSYTGDTNSTMFNEGRRSVGIKLFDDLLTAKPSAFQQMQREHNSEEKLDELEQERKLEELEGIISGV